MRFKAKPAYERNQDLKNGIHGTEPFEGFYDILDADGYVRGYYVDGYIVGKVSEVTDEYFLPDFWCPVDKTTLVKIGELK